MASMHGGPAEEDLSPADSGAPWLLRREGRESPNFRRSKLEVIGPEVDGEAQEVILHPPPTEERDLEAAGDDRWCTADARLPWDPELQDFRRWCLCGTALAILGAVGLGLFTLAVPAHRLHHVVDFHHTVTHGGPVHADSRRFDCSGNWHTWGPQQRLWCCREEGTACSATSMPFDCTDSDSVWSKEKQRWCCAAYNVACDESAAGRRVAEIV
ncbi:unnamed protein product [Effrenium voratum]|nr:unnamed protein product [Effrenium voratum]